ncbi:hypothetical protein SBOR_8438 [Sclerotinia borealis F-4128]|uniref:WSC domain-containing protein n=1 Tax=Sclerotinia borealis (strain F-4128) TaxID=1432307 RepID=W9C602_SCLBF|nr:hypothetical protein SBOR_8438 [Sclerotinia borealis F-4128]
MRHLSNLFIAFLGITSITASQSSNATNVCIDALLSEPGNAKDFCIQYLLLSTIPVPSFASPCLGTNPSENQLFRSCYEVLTQLKKEVPLPTALHFDAIDKPSKRAESLHRDGGFFNTGSVSSVSTSVGTYDSIGCFEDGVRGKPMGSPLLNLTEGPAETIQSCVNACSTMGRNGLPYLYAGIEPGSCWCSNYISILSIRSASFCQSSCPSNSGRYCGGFVGSIPHMQIYELKDWSGNVSPTSTTSGRTASSSSLRSSTESSSLKSQSRTLMSSSSLSTLSSKTTSTQKSSSSSIRSPDISVISTTSTARNSSSSLSSTPQNTFTTVSPTEVKISSSSSIASSLLSSSPSSFSPSFTSVVIASSPSLNSVSSSSSLSTSQVLAPSSSSINSLSSPPPYISESVASTLTTFELLITSEISSTSLPPIAGPSPTTNTFGLTPDSPSIPPIVGPTGTEPYTQFSGTFASPGEVSTTDKPNPWASLSLEEPNYYTQIPSDAIAGYVEPTTTVSTVSSETLFSNFPPPFPPRKVKREYNINAPDSPWKSLLPLTSPEIVKEVPLEQVPGWEQQLISLPSSRSKRGYDINAPDSPWPPLLPLSRPEIIKEVPLDQVSGWQGQPSAPLIPDSDVPPRPKPKNRLHRRQFGPIPDDALEPPGRPDFIKKFPEKNNNKPVLPPFDRIKEPVDPKTGKKITKSKPKYSHSKISLKKRPSLKDLKLQQNGRPIDQSDGTTNEVSKKEKDPKHDHKLHLQGTPKAYTEMVEKMARIEKGRVKNKVEDWQKKIFQGFGRGWDENEPFLREAVIINKILLNEEEDGDKEDDDEIGFGENEVEGRRVEGRYS